jgi:hypothetical protein
MSAEIQNAADVLRSKASEKVEEMKGDPRMVEVIQFIAALNALEVVLQQPKTTLAALFGFSDEESKVSAAIGLDEFVNISPLVAAKRYLEKVGRPARTLDDIIKGIRSGAGDVPNKSDLRIKLNRSGDVKVVGDDLFGLAAWYPKKRGRPIGGGVSSSEEDAHGEEEIESTEGDDEARPADLTAFGGDETEGHEEERG